MKSLWLQRDDRQRALVFFAGWGMDERPFRRLTSSQYDVCICCDYRELGFIFDPRAFQPDRSDAAATRESFKELATYDEVTVVAWSFGCAVAAQVMAHVNWPVHDALAINGTVTPEDDQTGIPRRWMDATAESLPEGGWPKFVRRMCLDKTAREDFQTHPPQRDLAGAIAELEVLRRLPTPAVCGFKRALIGTKDRIILPDNQERGWQRFAVVVHKIAAPHYPFHLWSTWEEVLATGTE